MTLGEIFLDIHAMEEDLLMFERKYGVLTETFYEAYQRGEEPEDETWVLDWSEWAGTYEILLSRRERYRQAIQSSLFCPLYFGLTLGTVAAQVQVGIGHAHPLPRAQLLPNLRHQRGVELEHLAAIQADKVIVRAFSHYLVMAVILAQAVFFHQPHLFENGQRTVDRRQADVGSAGSRLDVDRLGFQVPVAFLQHSQHGPALRGQPPARRSKGIAQVIVWLAHFLALVLLLLRITCIKQL